MVKVIITEKQLAILKETAMDLDRYSQLQYFDTNNGNIDISYQTKQTVLKLNELENMFETGFTIDSDLKIELYGVLQDIDNLYNKIKYKD